MAAVRAFVVLGGRRVAFTRWAGHGLWQLTLKELGGVDFVLDVHEQDCHMHELDSLLPRGLAELIRLRLRGMTCRTVLLIQHHWWCR